MASTVQGEDDDSWLYGGGSQNNGGKTSENETEEVNKESEEIGEDNSEINTDAPESIVEDGEAAEGVISESELENGGMKDDSDNFSRNGASENKLDDHVEEVAMGNDMLEDGANAVLDESLADGEAGSQEGGGSDDDDSDDDVQVTIGDIKAIPSYGYGSTPVNLNIKRVAGFGTPGVPSSAKTSKGIDIDSVGNVNGVPLYDFNLDTMEDKPWRKPGADITDYFNYGFNEDSWKIYCERQRKLRLENNVSGKVSVNHVTGLKDQLIPVASVNENSKYSAAVAINLGLKKAGPPPGRKLSGSIDVIGGGAPSLPSRRPVTTTKENVITVMTGRKFDTVPPGIPPPHLAPTHLPPPSFLSVPPEANLSIPPPPGAILPLTNIPPPPPGTPFQDHFASGRYSVPPPVVGGPMVGYEEHYYNGSHGGTYDETTQQSWPSSTRVHTEAHRERDRRERSREREHERTYAAWDYREHDARERERLSSRGGSVVGDEEYDRTNTATATSRRHRDYHERSRDRERERERSTGYEREYERDDRYDRGERDRDRRHKDHRSERDDRHRDRSSRRRHHHESDDEYDHRSSRHKHKRPKREKDDETSSNAPVSASESQDATELDMKQEL